MRMIKTILAVIIIAGSLTACLGTPAVEDKIDAVQKPELKALNIAPTRADPIPTPTHRPPTPTPEPVRLTATVWEEKPQVPILMYHRFDPGVGASSTRYKTSLADFSEHLSKLYDAGFSLVSLDDWLRGEIHILEGRRPLIITIDDLFFADQISLDETGQPADYSGVGRLWQFSQDHPEFGFQVSLFYNLGDKPYSNRYANGNFTVQDGWRRDRARAIAWGIENGALPFNHFYEHPFLKNLEPEEILWQLEENDAALRDALAMIGEEHLAADLPTILALPYVSWPKTEAGKQVLYDYTSPEGAPTAAIMVANEVPLARPAQVPSSPDFDPWRVPRIAASREGIDYILDIAAELPAASQCDLGEFPGESFPNPGLISEQILRLAQSGTCPAGYYIVEGLAFFLQNDQIIQLSP